EDRDKASRPSAVPWSIAAFPIRNPKAIDLGDEKSGRTMQGIYRVEGNLLAIVFDRSGARGRASEFISAEGTANDVLWILERIDGSAEKAMDLRRNSEDQGLVRRVVDVSDLADGDQRKVENLIQVITRTVVPESWRPSAAELAALASQNQGPQGA